MAAPGQTLALGRPPRYNPPRNSTPNALMLYMDQHQRDLDQYLERTIGAIQAYEEAKAEADLTRLWTITNDATDRTFDADTVVVAELADCFATLVHDFEEKGNIP